MRLCVCVYRFFFQVRSTVSSHERKAVNTWFSGMEEMGKEGSIHLSQAMLIQCRQNTLVTSMKSEKAFLIPASFPAASCMGKKATSALTQKTFKAKGVMEMDEIRTLHSNVCLLHS